MDLAIAAAATVVMESMTKAANRHAATARSLSTATLPAFGIIWNRNVINSVTRGWINNLLLKLRNSPLPRLRYDKLAAVFKRAFCNPYFLNPEWAEWKQLADAYMLDRRVSLEVIAQSITFLSGRSIPDPGSLAASEAGSIETMATASPDVGPLRTIWRLSRTAAAAAAPNVRLALPDAGLSGDAFKKAAMRCICPMERRHPNRPLMRLHLKAHPSFGKMGPPHRTGVLKKLKTAPSKANRFIKDNSRRNWLKRIRCPIPAATSDLNCYLQFCQLRGESASLSRNGVCWDGVPFSMIRLPTTTAPYACRRFVSSCWASSAWLTPARGQGPRKCQGESSKYPNFIRIRLHLRLAKSGKIRSDFAQACLIAFLFSFRVPPGTLQLHRAYRDDRLAEFSPHAEKSLVRVRPIDGADYLVVKLSSRRDLTFGVIINRPYFCRLDSDLARLAFPLHSLWPDVKARVPPRGNLCVAVNRRNFNRQLEAALAGLSVPQEDKYRPHAFRLGSAREMNETGSPYQSLLRLGHGAPTLCVATSP